MAKFGNFADIAVDIEDYVATIEIQRPPNNFFDVSLINQLGDALDALDEDDRARAVLLCSQGKHFCAGNDFSSSNKDVTVHEGDKNPLYAQGVRMFRTKKPIVAAIQGAAVGGGLGLALAADFRVACQEARFSANFAQLGFHHGFGLTITLPRLVGQQQANLLLFTGRRLKGDEALAIGMCDVLVDQADLRNTARNLCREIASSAPLAVQSIRATMRGDIADQYAKATDWESAEQARLRQTADFKEGVAATGERRPANFQNR